MKKKIKINNKYGFLMCICIIIGTVIGAGIFFKNELIFGFTKGNGVLGIVAWLLGGIISLLFGLSFIEISSCDNNSNAGIIIYAQLFGGNKFGKIVRNAINNIYIPLTFFVIAYYTIKSTIWLFFGGFNLELYFFNFFKSNIFYELFLFLFASIYVSIILFINIYYKNSGKFIQMITVILKIIPLLFIGIFGMFFFNSKINAFSNHGLGNKNIYLLVNNKTKFELILMAMPSILFSFEGFLFITYIKKDIKKSEINLPLSLFFGLLIITIIYLIVSIGTLNLDNTGNVVKAAGKIFDNFLLNRIFERIILFFILISSFGALNGYSMALLNLTYDSFEKKLFFFKKLFNKFIYKFGINKTIYIFTFILSFFWGFIMFFFNIFISFFEVLNNINFYDFISNSAVIMAFLIYSSIIFLGIINRFTNKVFVKKNNYFIFSSILSLFSIFLILGYNIFFYFYNALILENNLIFILQIISLLFILFLPLTGLFLNNKN